MRAIRLTLTKLQGESAMGQQGSKPKEISFTENAGDITVRVQGARVEFHTDGSILVYTNNAVKVSPIDDESGDAVASLLPAGR